ncbi:MAG: hypothetical protein IJD60_00510 [Clostridia bacterium]|nr:hypothetical protein [Clostridia bacterium]
MDTIVRRRRHAGGRKSVRDTEDKAHQPQKKGKSMHFEPCPGKNGLERADKVKLGVDGKDVYVL